jgi:hypothetical protein
MAKADHHRVVFKQAVKSNNITRGLQIHIQPHTFKADPLVLSEWEQAQKGSSNTLCDFLTQHYTIHTGKLGLGLSLMAAAAAVIVAGVFLCQKKRTTLTPH